MTRPIRTKPELLDYLATYASSRACERAIRQDQVVVLGGFTPAGDFPYWAVHITSRYGRQWIAIVRCDEDAYRFSVEWWNPKGRPKSEWVDWQYWAGAPPYLPSLMNGDIPQEALRFKREQNLR